MERAVKIVGTVPLKEQEQKGLDLDKLSLVALQDKIV